MSRFSSYLIAIALLSFGAERTNAASLEFFDHSAFLAATSNLTLIDFDDIATGNGALQGNEYSGEGLTIVQRDGWPINVLDPRIHHPNTFATNANSLPNVVSAVVGVFTGNNSATDNFDFIFSSIVTGAGLWIGNVGNVQPTTVEFLADDGTVIATEFFSAAADHPGFIFGNSGVSFDNRIFYGITSNEAIERIRVTQLGFGEGITLDDVQFGTGVVPIPPAIWLLGSGLLLLVRFKRN